MSDSELLAWENSRDMAGELASSIHEMLAKQTSSVYLSSATTARLNTGLSPTRFAKLLGISVRTLQEWESGRRQPSGPAKAVLSIAMRHPHVLRELSDAGI